MGLFANKLPYVREPVEPFRHFEYVPWSHIFPDFKGVPVPQEANFFADLVEQAAAKTIIDFAVGSGSDLSVLLGTLAGRGYSLDDVAGVDLDQRLLEDAASLFAGQAQPVSLHHADWLALPAANPPIDRSYDFGLLTGNSLTHLSSGDRASTRRALRRIGHGLFHLLRPGAQLLIDTRNFEFIHTLRNCSPTESMEQFRFQKSVYYHGTTERTRVFPAYISGSLVVMHYYNLRQEIWSANDFFPIYHRDMLYMLRGDFRIKQVYHDFSPHSTFRSLFVQYLVERV